jgi:hypothetical protein
MTDDLDESLARRLGALPRELAPPPALEERVVGSLRKRGLLGGRRSPLWWAGIAAAALIVFGGGVALGRGAGARPMAPGLHRFMLLLYEGPGFDAGDSTVAAARVEEYRSWARTLAERQRLVAGEELGKPDWMLEAGGSGVAVGPTGDPAVLPTGFFIVAARDSADAVALAESCPHLKHGGRVAVRAIRPT